MRAQHLAAASILAIGALAASFALAQPPAPRAPQPKATQAPGATGLMSRGPNETPRWDASGAAATRGLNICSGLWSGGLAMATIEEFLNGRDPSGRGGAGLKTDIDEKNRVVQVTYDPDMPPRIVAYRPVLGCVQLPPGAKLDAVKSLPQVASSVRAPNLDDQPWPLGDKDALGTLPPAKKAALDKLVEQAFDGRTYSGTTWGVVVVKDGKIVAERYAPGFDMHKASQTHSAAKSFASTVIGIAQGKGLIKVEKTPALKEWSRPGDPRGEISLQHLLRMSSGLYGQGTGSPQGKIYSQGGTVGDLAATNILHSKPGSTFLYNPPDTMLAMRSLRQSINNDRRYWAFPFQELFWKIGMTRTTTNSDWDGDFLMSGQTWSTARDFARWGILYENDGVFMGKRILPEGWVKYATTQGPAQPAGNGAKYGAQIWLYGGQSGLPADAFSPNGGQGHYAVTIPSKNLVVVRRGFDAGGGFQFTRFTADVMKALD